MLSFAGDHFAEAVNAVREQSEHRELEQDARKATAEYDQALIEAAENDEAALPSHANLMDKQLQALESASSLSRGDEQEVLQKLATFFAEEQALEAEFERATDDCLSEPFDFAALMAPTAIDAFVADCQNYIDTVARYRDQKRTVVTRWVSMVGPALADHEIAQSLTFTLRRTNELAGEPRDGTLAAGNALATEYIALVVILREHSNEWAFDESTEEVQFETDQALDAYNTQIDKALQAEERFNETRAIYMRLLPEIRNQVTEEAKAS